MTTRFEAELLLFTTAEGGRHTPIFAGYRPTVAFQTVTTTATVAFPEGTEMMMPGQSGPVVVTLVQDVAVQAGDRFAVAEGERVVGAGTVA